MTGEYTEEQLSRIREIDLELYHMFADICRRHGLTFVTGFGTTLGAVRHAGFIPWDDDMDFLMPREDYEKFVRTAPEELSGTCMELLEPRTTRGYVMTFAKLSRKDSVFLEAADEQVRYHSGICIDIFPMDYWPQDRKARNRTAFRCYVLARLCALSVYGRPKLPPGMSPLKKKLAHAGCMCIHVFLRLFRISTEKLYRRYRRLASSTSRAAAKGYVTDMTWCWIRKEGRFRRGMFGLQYLDRDLFTPLYVPFENTEIPVPEKYDAYLKTAYRDYMTLPPKEKRHCHLPSVLVFPEEYGQLQNSRKGRKER